MMGNSLSKLYITIGDTVNNFTFPIANLVVREEADIKRIARELYNLQQVRARAAGVA